MKITVHSRSALSLAAFFMTALLAGTLSGIPTATAQTAPAQMPPALERPDALKLRFSIMDEHILSWKRKDKGVWILMSPGAASSFYRFTSTHIDKTFDLYINGLYVISIMNNEPVKSGGLFISVQKEAQQKLINYLPLQKQKFD